VTVTELDDHGLLEVNGLPAEVIGDAASEHGIAVHELTPLQVSLEEAFMTLTRDEIEFKPFVGEKSEKDEVAA
jgi:ABC-2 type transport system ATP-binding protein